MSKPIKLYLDEDTINRALVNALRSRNVDTLTAQEADRMGLSDQEQLDYATLTNRTIFTFNTRDFVNCIRIIWQPAAIMPELLFLSNYSAARPQRFFRSIGPQIVAKIETFRPNNAILETSAV